MQKKHLKKFNTLLMIKTLKKLGIEEKYLYIIIKIILSGERLKYFPIRLGKNKDAHCHHCYSTSYQKSQPEHQEKKERKKRHLNWKQKVKLSLLADNMILYVENPKSSTQKNLVRTKTDLAKWQDIKSIHKDQLGFYTLTMNNLKRKLRKRFHLKQHQEEKNTH